MDLPASANHGYAATEPRAVADLRQRVLAHIARLHALGFAVIIR